MVFFNFTLVWSVDKSQFKTCAQSHFCKRNRANFREDTNVNIPNEFTFYLDPTSIKQISLSTIEATIYPLKKPNDYLVLQIQSIEEGILQFKIDKHNSHRYQGIFSSYFEQFSFLFFLFQFEGPNEVLIPFNTSNFEKEVTILPSKMILFIHNPPFKQRIEVYFSPFRVNFFMDEDYLIMSFNEKHLFQFEHFKSKEDDDVPSQIPMADASKPETWDDEEDGLVN